MNYWPMTTIAYSPLLNGAYAGELHAAFASGVMLSTGALQACAAVTRQTPPCRAQMAILTTDYPSLRRVYWDRPSPEDFAKLERSGFMASKDFFYFVVDQMH